LDHGLDVNQPFSATAGTVPVICSIEKKRMSILKLLLEKGAGIGLNPYGTSTPLHAAAGRWPEAIPVLLEAGADVNARSTTGRTPLMSAAFGNQISSLDVLLAAGGRLEDCDNEGTSPLILAARAGKAEAVDWLLDHGADIHAQDKRGKTALDWAKANGHQQIAKSLQSRMGS
jgi:cytohesin